MGDQASHGGSPPYTAQQALARLKEGNARFMAGQARFPTVQKEILAELAKGQSPFATVLGCSDSRVPPELVFDASFGELFVIRVAGNVLGPAIAGTLQYAGTYLHTPLLVVLGHEGCGAVDAAIADHFHGAIHANRVDMLLDNIIPAIASLDPTQPHEQLLDQAVEANVRWTLRLITQSPEWGAHERTGDVQAVGAIYDLNTGAVRFLD